MRASCYKSGQVWSFKCSSKSQDSRLMILKEEVLGNQHIVHIATLGGDGVSHMPFSREAINNSVVELVEESKAIPEYEDGYLYWKELFEKGEAGVYKIAVDEALCLMGEGHKK